MKVLFDLRPQHLVRVQDQQVDLLRLLSVLLFVAFVLLSLFNIGNITYNLRDVNVRLAATHGNLSVVTANSNRLAARIEEMRVLRDRTRAYLEFTRQELPSIEFMAALEGIVTSGMKVESLELRPGSATMRGSALTDQDIVDFSARLDGMKNITSLVDAPITTKGSLGAAMISEFAISCTLRSISDIAASMPESPGGAALDSPPPDADGTQEATE
ncbi:MAG: hypothetical protein LBT31_08415 [Synergistaceae bacterium]|jgi:hypothetical protein|nr:hypothetical protein [Synergistaceae bacterium]